MTQTDPDSTTLVADLLLDAEPMDAEPMDAERLGALLPDAIEQLRRRADGKDKPIALGNWPRLADRLGGGLWPGCHILTGETGSGKSQLALQLALQAAREGIPTRYVALELDSLGLVARLLCMAAGDKAGVWWSRLYNGQGDRNTTRQSLDGLFRAHGAELHNLPLYLSTEHGPHGWSYDRIEPTVKDLRARHPEAEGRPVLVVVDFLQLLSSPDGKREETRETIGRAAYAARSAARKHGAAVLMLSSTARAQYDNMRVNVGLDGMPTTPAYALVGAGKESGDIEYSADTAMVLCKSLVETPAGQSKELWLAVAKQRAGQGGWVRLEQRRGWFYEGADHSIDGKEAARAKAAMKAAKQGGNPSATPARSGRDKAGGLDDD